MFSRTPFVAMTLFFFSFLASLEAYTPPMSMSRRSPGSKSFGLRLSHGGIGGGLGGGSNGGDGMGWWNNNNGDGEGSNNEGGDMSEYYMSGGFSAGALWTAYNNALESNPIVTKGCTSFVGFSLGDFLAQKFLGSKDDAFDYARLIRLASFGLLLHGPIGHYFYGFLDSQMPKTDPITVALKVLIDQVLWAPIFTVLFFTYIGLASGDGPNKIIEKCKKDVITGVTGSWKVWPIAHAINFKFIPSSQRLLYINTIQVGYNIFLSMLSSK